MLADSLSPAACDLQPRLVIDKISVENFKSYLGRHTIGPLHLSFSAIVGPNGSGKSNVIDAIMFVLGSRARKLRQGKLGELVHLTEGTERVESCSELNSEIIPGSQFTVSRTAFKNSRNFYMINGQECSQGEVSQLLKSHGVDLDHKRFLILQGEVELISQMKPKASNEHEEGLLEYLEDIIGTGHYAEKIEGSAREMDTANAECSEKLLKTRHCEKELSLLTEEKDTAEIYLNVENSIAEKKSELFQILKYQHEKQLAKAQSTLTTAANALAKEQEKNAHQITAVEQIEVELKERGIQYAAVERENTELLKRMKRLENEDVAIREKKAFLKKKLMSLGKSTADSERKRNDAERELSNLQVEKERLSKQLPEFLSSIEENEAQLTKISAGLKGKTEGLQNELAKKQEEMQPWQEKYRKTHTEFEIVSGALNDHKKKLAAVGEELEGIAANIELNEKDLADAQENKENLLCNQKEMIKQRDKFTEQKQMAESKQAQVGKDVQVLQDTLCEAKEALQNSTLGAGSAAVTSLMKDAKKIGGGIYGRLGDLGVIDGKYDVAVSTASPQLNFVVVDTTETGQRCVDYLKKNNLGRASFIILEKMHNVHTSNAHYPDGVERLFDLVTPRDKMFSPAFFFALGETLVAPNMDIASQVAYNGPKRNRVVTLDGKLIDTVGTMSGGGKKMQRGAMRLRKGNQNDNVEKTNVSEEQLNELHALYEQKMEEQRILKAMIAEFAQNIQVISKQLKQMELELAKIEQVLIALPGQISDLKGQMADIQSNKKNGKKDANILPNLESNYKAAEAALKKTEADMAPFLAEVAAIEEKIMEAGGVKYKVQKSKLEGLREQLALTESRLAKVSAEIAILETSSKSSVSQSKDEKQKKEEAALEKEISLLDEQMEGFTTQAIEVKTKTDELSAILEEQKDAINELKKSLEQHNRVLSKFRKHEFELKLKKEELERECEECENNINRYNQAQSTLKLNEFSKKYDYL